MRGRLGKMAVLPAVVGLLAAGAAIANAELTASGDLFVRFDGGIAPKALPRHGMAPVSVQVEGVVTTLSGDQPPALREITIALNRGGRLDTEGLPVCHRRELEPSSSEEALQRCGPALVGTGSYSADIAFPEQSAFPSYGHVLAFNAVVGGRPAVLAHIYAAHPAPVTRVVAFRITERSGTFRTVLSSEVPERLNRWGYLKRVKFDLFRTYTYRGRLHSYLSASCAAPPGFPGAVFPFARATMAFADGRTLSSTLTRTCRVRKS